jgi:hypothetical protein
MDEYIISPQDLVRPLATEELFQLAVELEEARHEHDQHDAALPGHDLGTALMEAMTKAVNEELERRSVGGMQ